MRLNLLLLALAGCGAWDQVWVSAGDLDRDLDGLTFNVDCDDDDPSVRAPTWYPDGDGDGYGSDGYPVVSCAQPDGTADNNEDCDDSDAESNPDAVWYSDSDGDGDGRAGDPLVQCQAPEGYVTNPLDCDDDDPSLNRDTVWYSDADGDGFGSAVEDDAVRQCEQPAGFVASATDCDDLDAQVYVGAAEVCDDVDNDCDGDVDDDDVDTSDALTWYIDADGDGYGSETYTKVLCAQPEGYVVASGDCDDGDPTLNPASVWYEDADGDGWGSPMSVTACEPPEGYVTDDDDCHDGDAAINPEAQEVCDGVDNNCDGRTDDDDSGVEGRLTWYIDEDGDGYGSDASTVVACSQPADHVDNAEDCDDDDATLSPLTEWYVDYDGDGYGSPSLVVTQCEAPVTYFVRAGDPTAEDCDDLDAEVHPGATDLCTVDVDYDCDGVLTYVDADGDGAAACVDCDDLDPARYPGADETAGLCGDAVLNDCEETTSEAFATCHSAGLNYADSTMLGEDPYDVAGYAVAGAGDVNGDGSDDLLVGAYGHGGTGGSLTGAAYLVLGSAAPTDLDLADADAIYEGASGRDAAGYAVAGAGDVDGDGLADVLVGAWGDSGGGSYAGAAHLILGSGAPADLSLGDADATYSGYGSSQKVGLSVSGGVDVDGDAMDDLLVGGLGGGDSPGVVWLVLGGAPSDSSLASAHATWTGEDAEDYPGEPLSCVLDVDGDGLGEALIGAAGVDVAAADAGAAYLMLGGGASGSGSLADADAIFTGEAAEDGAGTAVAGAGDIDADGYADLLVGAPREDTTASAAGAAYLLLGGSGVADRGLAEADAKLLGVDGALAGSSIAGLGDLDGDGLGELAVGAVQEDAEPYGDDYVFPNAGAVWVVFGGEAPSGAALLSSVGVKVFGAYPNDYAGSALAAAGDVNGDGSPDLLVGAWGNDGLTDCCDSGAAYLILGPGY